MSETVRVLYYMLANERILAHYNSTSPSPTGAASCSVNVTFHTTCVSAHVVPFISVYERGTTLQELMVTVVEHDEGITRFSIL